MGDRAGESAVRHLGRNPTQDGRLRNRRNFHSSFGWRIFDGHSSELVEMAELDTLLELSEGQAAFGDLRGGRGHGEEEGRCVGVLTSWRFARSFYTRVPPSLSVQ